MDRPGLIPARAGRTRSSDRSARPLGAHPRSRGADSLSSLVSSLRRGSSPLARGARGHCANESAPGGLIPARAGRTSPSATESSGTRAHPRSRGADTVGWDPPMQTWGSSPLARGGPMLQKPSVSMAGLIPARAGRTPRRVPQGGASWAHPRSRGADLRRASLIRQIRGSSPLARGGHRDAKVPIVGVGLIPARAGRTCSRC